MADLAFVIGVVVFTAGYVDRVTQGAQLDETHAHGEENGAQDQPQNSEGDAPALDRVLAAGFARGVVDGELEGRARRIDAFFLGLGRGLCQQGGELSGGAYRALFHFHLEGRASDVVEEPLFDVPVDVAHHGVQLFLPAADSDTRTSLCY